MKKLQRLRRFTQVRARMRDAAKAELAIEEAALCECDCRIAEASAMKTEILRQQRALQAGASSAHDFSWIDTLRKHAEKQHLQLLQLRVEQEKKTALARQTAQHADRQWQRAGDLLRDAEDEQERKEQKEIELLPRKHGGGPR